jgi:predicted ATPase
MLSSNLYLRSVAISKEIPKGNYLKDLPVVKNLTEMGSLSFSKNVTFLVGENGVGKSTLIEAIAVAMGFNPEGGTKNFNFATMESHSDLHTYMTMSRGFQRLRDGFFLRAESFMALVENRFYGNGLYILDEPEAALSPMRQMRLMYLIKELEKKNSQFIISTHSPILMTYPGAEVLEVSDEGIKSVDYKETEHYMITKRFMDAPGKITKELLGE